MNHEQQFQAKRIAADYLQSFEKLLRKVDLDAIERIVKRLRDARDRGATTYVAGNGGSAATASHRVNDLGKATKDLGRLPKKRQIGSRRLSRSRPRRYPRN